MNRKSSRIRKKEIVQATFKLIADEGVRGLTTARIAQKVGFSEAALYRHFSTKQEIIKATIDAAGQQVIKTLSTATSSKNALKNLKKVLEAHLRFIEENPGITRLLFSDEIHFNNQNLRAKLFQIMEGVQSFIRDLLEQGINSGEIKGELDVETAATFYLGVIQSQVLLWSLSGGRRSLSDQISQLWEAYKAILKG